MKIQRFLRLTTAAAILTAGTAAAPAAEPTRVVEGRLTQITTDYVTVDGGNRYRIDPEHTVCFDFRAARTTCETLALIGYADKARVSLIGTIVTRIDLLELQQ